MPKRRPRRKRTGVFRAIEVIFNSGWKVALRVTRRNDVVAFSRAEYQVMGTIRDDLVSPLSALLSTMEVA